MKITREQKFAFYGIILEIGGEGQLSHKPALINFTFLLSCFPISLASALFYWHYCSVKISEDLSDRDSNLRQNSRPFYQMRWDQLACLFTSYIQNMIFVKTGTMIK